MFKKLFGQNENYIDSELSAEVPLPKHVAIIMDGNGRWAKRRFLPRIAGHKEGMNVVKKITKYASSLGIEVLTLYAFSTENWKRPTDEVDFLMKLPVEFFETFVPELVEENVRVNIMGYRENLPAHTLKSVEDAIEATKHCTGLVLNFALNYGGRAEILSATKAAILELKAEGRNPEDITEADIDNHLMSQGLGDPDLLIRTSGELRLSNFMLWQLAYSEFYFTEVHWPDFKEEDFLQAMIDYQNRSRRYGGL
ncbi:isoprenyl transferase [Listeria fleischmannii]|jgi:undecaprenyl diphosphate synthase|uniref:Isoprenyl transferase n=2 Tax=Listeria fleischmannii TaxID=1069827 RepID=W7DHJ4_9LIST|nr:isoprenyl transferase [Listeria fleischmannii]EIA20708.1 undecaprenyl pyrophosphate synthase [Listeria fleischmannii subsp. coloradonensis]EUJ60899.1 undecaprenyl pyrophosphate synthase [Listeria fleischmannii FSL S10-1203]MBC1399637.1 isoprenyl transferase [Listeria fleischmannii]MBC1419607.1 isoprenyl transferase [Listeria fleischmannii]MBC1427966.1 isoprenyl transferase [Listeria fleischmannii]